MKSTTKTILILGIAVAVMAGLVLAAVRYMDVIQRQFEVFRDLINRRRRGAAEAEDALDFEDDDGDHFDAFEATPDESIPDLSF